MSLDQEIINVANNPEKDNNIRKQEQQNEQLQNNVDQEAKQESIVIDKQEDIDIDKHENIDIDKQEKIDEFENRIIDPQKQENSIHHKHIQSDDHHSSIESDDQPKIVHDELVKVDAGEQVKIDTDEQIKIDTDEPIKVDSDEQDNIVTDEQEDIVGDLQNDSPTISQQNNDDEIPLQDSEQENGDEREHIDEGAEQPIEDNNGSSDMIEGNEEIMDELRNIATTGTVSCDWGHLQKILQERLESVLTRYIERSGNKYRDEEYQEPNVEKFELENSRKEIVHLISSFSEPPFTIQRICELLCTPFTYYDKISTFLRGLEKNLRVS